MKKLHNPHDKIFRQSLSNIEIAKDFLQIYIPAKILAKIVGLLEFIQKHIYDRDLYLVVDEINQLITRYKGKINLLL